MAEPLKLNTNFSEFVYTAVRQAPVFLQRRLPEKYFRRVMAEKAARTFATKASFEDKCEVLSYLGINYFLVFADVNKLQSPDIRKIFSDLNEEDKGGTLKRFSDESVFISSSREFCYKLFHAAQIQDGDGYAKVLEMVRTSHHIKKWSSRLKFNDSTKEEEENLEQYVAMLGGVLMASSFPLAFSEVDMPTLTILLYLFKKKGYVSHTHITNKFGFTKQQVTGSIRKCLGKMYVQRHPVDAKKEYMISATGILAVNRFVEKVSNSIDF